MSNLKSAIAGLAEEFAAGVLAAIRAASLEEILDHSAGGRGRSAAAGLRGGRGNGRRVRRTAADIAAAVDAIETLLMKHPTGMRAEQIRKELGLEAKELPRPLAEGVSQKRFSKEGQKRATTYFAKGAGATKNGTAKGGPRRGKRRSA